MNNNLVLIPGLNNTGAVFDGVVAALPQSITSFALTCPAMPSVDAIAQTLLAGLPDRFWLTGFSFGGYVALAMLAAAPERIQGLALVCTGPHTDRPDRVEARLRSIETARNGDYLAMVESTAGNTMHPDHLNDEELMRARRKMVEAYGAERYVAHASAAVARPDRLHLLTPALPTLIVGARQDKVFPLELAQALAVEVPHARLHIIENSGHLAPMEQPQRLAGILAGWVEEGRVQAS